MVLYTRFCSVKTRSILAHFNGVIPGGLEKVTLKGSKKTLPKSTASSHQVLQDLPLNTKKHQETPWFPFYSSRYLKIPQLKVFSKMMCYQIYRHLRWDVLSSQELWVCRLMVWRAQKYWVIYSDQTGKLNDFMVATRRNTQVAQKVLLSWSWVFQIGGWTIMANVTRSVLVHFW